MKMFLGVLMIAFSKQNKDTGLGLRNKDTHPSSHMPLESKHNWPPSHNGLNSLKMNMS